MQNDPMLEDTDEFPPLSDPLTQPSSVNASARLRGQPKPPNPPPIINTLNKFWGSKMPATPLTLVGKIRSSKSRTPAAINSLTADIHMELIDPSKEKDKTNSPNPKSATTRSSSGTSESLSTLSTPTKPPPQSALKQSKTTKTSATKVPSPITHPLLDSYKFKTVVEISVKIPKTDQVYPMLREKMLSSLSFIQRFGDPSAAIIPRDGSVRDIPIYDEPSFPLEQFTTGMHFFVYQNDYSLFPNRQDSRMVRLSTNMGFNVDPRTFLHIMKVDLMGIGATFEVKLEQALNTCSKIVFLGAPQTINKAYAKQVMDMHLIPLEKELMVEDSITFPPEIHGGPWPSYSMIIEQPGGMFEPMGKGMSRAPPPRERRCLQLLCSADVYDRLASL